ncbi:unnamed protein product, partial [Dovyalis caffra]
VLNSTESGISGYNVKSTTAFWKEGIKKRKGAELVNRDVSVVTRQCLTSKLGWVYIQIAQIFCPALVTFEKAFVSYMTLGAQLLHLDSKAKNFHPITIIDGSAPNDHVLIKPSLSKLISGARKIVENGPTHLSLNSSLTEKSASALIAQRHEK